MNAHSITKPARVYSPVAVCPDCEGTQTITAIAHVAGEAYDADYVELPCEACHATGEVGAYCEGCSQAVPCLDGYCAECDGFIPFEIIPLVGGAYRIAPTEVVVPIATGVAR